MAGKGRSNRARKQITHAITPGQTQLILILSFEYFAEVSINLQQETTTLFVGTLQFLTSIASLLVSAITAAFDAQ